MADDFRVQVQDFIEVRQALQKIKNRLENLNTGKAGAAFTTINCPAGTDPTAGSTVETLNLTAATSALTITGTAGTDTVEFEVVPGQIDLADLRTKALNNLSDVSATPTNKYVLQANGLSWSSVSLPVNDLSDVDTATASPSLNNVLKWDGNNWRPGIAGDTSEFTFSIDSFSDGISDTSQLIGSGVWQAVGAISFTASYSNAPGGMTASVAMSGSATNWSGNMNLSPVTGPDTNDEAVEYPASATGTITFTLAQSADGTTDTEQVSFSNTMRYGTNTTVPGSQSDATVEALTEVSGPNESRSQTISNISNAPTHYVTFAYADRLSDVQQVRINTGDGYVTASFNSTRTTVAPTIQTSGLTTVENSAGFEEAFACVTSTDTGLADGSNDFQVLTSSTAQNYIRIGGNTESTPGNYTESDIETGLTDDSVTATNDNTRTWSTVTLASSEHFVYAQPARLSTPDFYDNTSGFAASFQSPATLTITNDGGFQEDYEIFVSTNPLGPGDFTLRTE